ncbi:MAG: hypothetical protein HY075_05020 [Deltaproteobacteria bacterium]|nr:hypothetical protein [Deltaproteobacteria bacterium]
MNTTTSNLARNFVVFVLCLFLASGVAAKHALALKKKTAGRAVAAKTEEMLPATEVKSSLASAADSVTDMYVSHDYKATNPKAHPGEDILSFEAQIIRDFHHGTGVFSHLKGVPPEQKGFVLRRYEEGDKDVTEAMIEIGKTKAYKLVLGIFDFNPAFDGVFKDGEKHNSDFEHAKPKNAPMAEMMQRLQTDGHLPLNNTTHGIVSQPLYNGDMAPIMHNKDLIFITYDTKGAIKDLVLFTGSNNMTRNPRYNRMLRIVDPLAIKYILANCQEMAEHFAKGETIKDMKAQGPLRITYKDGTTAEYAFTDGKYNPNDRIQATLERAGKGEIKMKRAVFSQFVFTDGDVIEGLRGAMKTNTEMDVFAVLDDKFLALDEYGKGGALAGYQTSPEHGKATFGFSNDMRKRIKAFGYQKKAEGREETDPDGPPLSREVWHDKTTVLIYEEDGVEWVEVFTGSFNLSTNGANAELQVKFRVPAKSEFGRMFIESVEKVAALNPEFCVPLETAVFRNYLGKFLGHSIFEIAVAKVESIMSSLRGGKSSQAIEEMREIGGEPTTLSKKLSKPEVEGRLSKLKKLFDWRGKNNLPERIYPQQFTAAAFGIGHPEASPGRVIQQMRQSVWSPGAQNDALDQRAKEAMTELGLPLPSERDAKDGGGGGTEGGRPPRGPRGGGGGGKRGGKGVAEACEDPLVDPSFKPGDSE